MTEKNTQARKGESRKAKTQATRLERREAADLIREDQRKADERLFATIRTFGYIGGHRL